MMARLPLSRRKSALATIATISTSRSSSTTSIPISSERKTWSGAAATIATTTPTSASTRFKDGRNAYLFEMNALGTQDDATITDENLTIDSFSWDAVWRSETVIDDEGWSMEVSIPFRQLRFPEGDNLDFGLMLSRTVNRKNERSLWPPIGLEYAGSSFNALAIVSQYGTLKGIKNVARGKNLEIKPYVITGSPGVPFRSHSGEDDDGCYAGRRWRSQVWDYFESDSGFDC